MSRWIVGIGSPDERRELGETGLTAGVGQAFQQLEGPLQRLHAAVRSVVSAATVVLLTSR